MSEAMDLLTVSLAALTVALRDAGLDEDLCAEAIYPGDSVPADYGLGECGGMAWVRLMQASPSAQFPAAAFDVNNCTYTLAYSMEMGILRPAPIPGGELSNEYELPSDTDHIEATRRQMDDLEVMHAALKTIRANVDLCIIGTYMPIGPEGGTVGGRWDFTVGQELD